VVVLLAGLLPWLAWPPLSINNAALHVHACPPACSQEALHAAGLHCDHFDEIEGQARAAARQTAAAEERASQLAEEAVSLRLELAARPTQAGQGRRWLQGGHACMGGVSLGLCSS
jgi:hypothetical protein